MTFLISTDPDIFNKFQQLPLLAGFVVDFGMHSIYFPRRQVIHLVAPPKGPPLWTLFDVPRCRAHPDDSLARINLVPSLLYLSFFMSLAT